MLQVQQSAAKYEICASLMGFPHRDLAGWECGWFELQWSWQENEQAKRPHVFYRFE